MDLRTLLVTMLRRWYVVVPILALTAYMSMSYMDSVDPEYQASGSVLLIGPSQDVETKVVDGVRQQNLVPRNPYVRFNSALSTTAAIVAESITRGEFRRNLRTFGLSSDITLDVGDKVPLIAVEVVGESAEQAMATLDATLAGIDTELTARQDAVGAPAHDRFAAEVVGRSEGAQPLTAARDRAVAATALIGVGAAVGMALLFENVASSRRPRGRHVRRSPGAYPPALPVVAAEATWAPPSMFEPSAESIGTGSRNGNAADASFDIVLAALSRATTDGRDTIRDLDSGGTDVGKPKERRASSGATAQLPWQ